MPDHVVLLSIPGLRAKDLASMPNLRALCGDGDRVSLVPSFPAVTCPVQVNMTTGKLPRDHGVVANGFYWRDKQEVEMWTAWNSVIEQPQLWDILHQHDSSLTSAVWFPLLSKGCGADYICTPAPIHNPDGSESLWCYTKPTELYGELRDKHGHFPLMNFWGPMAGIKSSQWIADSAATAAHAYKPNLFYIYLPHLDYAAQKTGPDSPQALEAVVQLDVVIGGLAKEFAAAYAPATPLWIVASEYTITPVDHVLYPNRMLREAGLLQVKTDDDGGELIDFAASAAWALADHQHSHIFVSGGDSQILERVRGLFQGAKGVDEVLIGPDKEKHFLDHPRSGDAVLVSSPNSWQAYYYWLEDSRAPKFAHTVDIHRKPGYDPVELHFNPATRSIPLDATLIGGSHGAPPKSEKDRGLLLTSQRGVLEGPPMADTDVAELVLRQFGI